jgi:hypothetical protein
MSNMVYPILEVNSLKARCADDIDTFVKNVLGGHSNSIQSVMYELYPNEGEVSYDDVMDFMVHPLELFNSVLQKKSKTMKTFDYAHDILHFDEQDRNKLWIMRTLLCYQMMIFGTLLMENKALHDEVYKHISSFTRPFRPEVVSELKSFKLGIFGSITPTSDIDIGIQYSGFTSKFAALDYVVATMEDMFIYFLDITSTLKLDIEYYADMMTLPNPDTANEKHPDFFYLDTSSFTKDDFTQMVPYAYASIYRNYVTAKKDLGIAENNSKNIDDLSAKIQAYDPRFVINTDAMRQAKDMVQAYMKMPYANAREKYYQLVNAAEVKVAKIRDIIGRNSYDELTNPLILQSMINIARSLIFRAESYVCAPTVMHIVRVLQATNSSKLKYPVLYPEYCSVSSQKMKLLNPECEIGKYGYELSKLEQIGYIIRFKMTYCDPLTSNHNSNQGRKEKCIKKQGKYTKRLFNADERIKAIDAKNVSGGYRKRKHAHITRKKRRQQVRRKHTRHGSYRQ